MPRLSSAIRGTGLPESSIVSSEKANIQQVFIVEAGHRNSPAAPGRDRRPAHALDSARKPPASASGFRAVRFLAERNSGRPAALYRFHCPLRRFVGHLYRRFRDPAGALKETLQIVTQEFALDRGHILRSAAEQQAFEAIEILLHALTREIHPFSRDALSDLGEDGARLDDRIKIVGRFLRSLVRLLAENAADAAELIGRTLGQMRRDLGANCSASWTVSA